MNELEFIREQVRLERRHMAEVRQALETALLGRAVADPSLQIFCQAAARYLVFIVQRFNAQDQIHCDQLRSCLTAEDATSLQSLEQLHSTLAQSRPAVAQLSAALASPASMETLLDACRRYLDFYRHELLARKNSLYPLFDQHYGMADWRRASLVDADSVLEERTLYATVKTCLPVGIELKSAGQRPTAA
jgi:hypothetical protein